MIASGAFNGDEAIAELVMIEGEADLGYGAVKVGAIVSHPGRWDEDPPIEIGQEEFGADLGRVKADDAKMFWSDLLDAGMKQAARLTNRGGRPT
jgi:hypothetical protein